MSMIDSKNLLVWVKAMSRGQALPLDASEIHESLAAAQTYAASAIAYEGQTIKAKLEDGKYHEYILQPSEAGYVLEEVGAVSASDLKQYVMVVESLPEAGQEQGILYICGTTGSVWTGTEWRTVFWDVTATINAVADRVTDLETDIDTKAPIANPVFSGVVKVGEEEVAIKSYVESLFAQLEESSVPEIVDSSNPLPITDYKAGRSYRVAEAGTYAGVNCEIGDLILVVKDYTASTASDADFMVLQSNIDGAVTSKADATTIGEIVVFDAVTGKVIKGSGVQIASLKDAIAKAHEHSNKEKLDTFDKTQEEILAAAKSEAEGLVSAAEGRLNTALEGKANKGTTLAEYGITDAYTKTEEDAFRKTITDNLNSKASSTEVDEKVAEAKQEIEEKIGDIPTGTTVKEYIDNSVGSGGTASAEAIATAKQEAINTSKEYTDTKLAVVEF